MALDSRPPLSPAVQKRIRAERARPSRRQPDYMMLRVLREQIVYALSRIETPLTSVLDVWAGTKPYRDLLPEHETYVSIDLDVRHIRRIKTQIRLERINLAIERYNAQYQDSPLPADYQSLYSRLVSTGFLPGTPDYRTDAWGQTYVADPGGVSQVVAVTSDSH